MCRLYGHSSLFVFVWLVFVLNGRGECWYEEIGRRKGSGGEQGEGGGCSFEERHILDVAVEENEAHL